MTNKKVYYGGQAVIEGVMMRGEKTTATAVRKSDGTIIINELPIPASNLPKFLKWPFIRGTVNLISSLVTGINTLIYSANQSLDEGEQEEELSPIEIALTIVVSLGLGICLFMLLPAFLSGIIKSWITSLAWQNVIEGVLRIVIFLIYIIAISQLKDIKRVFMYHGAEHKTIYNYESDVELSVENAKKMSRFHPRCGTSFLVYVMLISILVYSLLPDMTIVMRLVSRVLLLPVIAGISYEILRVAGCHLGDPKWAWLSWAGLQIQRFTTAEPDESQLEVAIAALKTVLTTDGVLPEEERPENVVHDEPSNK